jgi:hypothetical protein
MRFYHGNFPAAEMDNRAAEFTFLPVSPAAAAPSAAKERIAANVNINSQLPLSDTWPVLAGPIGFTLTTDPRKINEKISLPVVIPAAAARASAAARFAVKILPVSELHAYRHRVMADPASTASCIGSQLMESAVDPKRFVARFDHRLRLKKRFCSGLFPHFLYCFHCLMTNG